MVAAAGEDAGHWTHVVEIPAIRDCDMPVLRLDVIGRIEIHPAHAVTIDRKPRVARIGSYQPRLARRRTRAQITAHGTRGQTQRAQACDAEMREFPAHTATF